MHFATLHFASLYCFALYFISLRFTPISCAALLFTSIQSTPLHCSSLLFPVLHSLSLQPNPLRFTALHSSVGVVTPNLDIGCTASDEDCWETFKELFYPVIKAYHGYDPETQVRHIYNRISLLLAYHDISISRSAIVIMRHGVSAACSYLLFLSISNDVCLKMAIFVQVGNAHINSY